MTNDEERRAESLAPDPTRDRWSAWLPDLGESDTPPASATQPLGPTATAPLPALPPPAPAPPLPSPPLPSPTLPGAPLPGAPLPGLPLNGPPLPQASAPWLRSTPGARATTAPAWQATTRPPKTHIGLAIIALLVAPIPFGIVAVVRAASVWPHRAAGRAEAARRAARSARNWSIAGLALVGVIFVGTTMLGLLLSLTAAGP